jgi:hypothetical protein
MRWAPARPDPCTAGQPLGTLEQEDKAMSSELGTPTGHSTSPLSTKNKIGLALAGLLGLLDLLPMLGGPAPDPNQPGPPFVVLVAGAVLAVITLVAVVYTWRTGHRAGARIVAGSRIISAATALPAFFVPGVPAGLVAIVAAAVVVTAVTVALVLSRPTSRT